MQMFGYDSDNKVCSNFTQMIVLYQVRQQYIILSQRSQRQYLLKLLHSQGLSTIQLDQVSLIVSWLWYAHCTACLVWIFNSWANK